MVDEYIKRETAIVRATRIFGLQDSDAYDVKEALKAIPSADVEEVRHGKWEEGLCYDYYSKGVLESKCSICGSWNLFDSDGYNCESNFCPNCGARMDGE